MHSFTFPKCLSFQSHSCYFKDRQNCLFTFVKAINMQLTIIIWHIKFCLIYVHFAGKIAYQKINFCFLFCLNHDNFVDLKQDSSDATRVDAENFVTIRSDSLHDHCHAHNSAQFAFKVV